MLLIHGHLNTWRIRARLRVTEVPVRLHLFLVLESYVRHDLHFQHFLDCFFLEFVHAAVHVPHDSLAVD